MRTICVKKAFSLIEVLVALTLFAIAVTSFTQSTFYALTSLNILQSAPARDLDLSFVREQVLQIEKQEKVQEGGTIETLNSGEATWTASVEPTDIIDVYRLTLSTEFKGTQDIKTYETKQVLYIFRPKWTDTADRKKSLQEKKDKRNNK